MRIRKLWWDWHDWGLSIQSKERDNGWLGLFAFRCSECRKFTLGCGDPDCQWFCGYCKPCLIRLEAWMAETEAEA